jgi:hypothetical protein
MTADQKTAGLKTEHRTADEAAAHDAFFRAEVARAIEEADDPDAKWLTNEEVKTLSAEHRAKWRAAAARKT